jgi:hypothetical protein
MPTANAERQRRYRARHLGPSGDLARLQLYLSLNARDQLDRLAWHLGYSVTQLVEQLTASAERNVEAKLTDKALKTYRAAGHEDAAFREAR